MRGNEHLDDTTERRIGTGSHVQRFHSHPPIALTQAQFDALVVGLPWQRLPEMSTITRL